MTPTKPNPLLPRAKVLNPKVGTTAPRNAVTKAIVRAFHSGVGPIVRKIAPAVRPYGVHPLAWALILQSGVPSRRIGQTIGHAAASAGTHVKTGEYQGHDYCPCLDLHVRDLTHAQVIARIVRPLAALGFAVYMRVPGQDHWPAGQVYHVHAIYPACNVTPAVAHQVEDWLHQPDTLNGLASHVTYRAYQATHDERAACRPLFAQHKIVEV